MVKSRIACFLTCGYTEAGAMQAFLRKINDNYDYKQYLPNKTIKKKGMPRTISDKVSGLTGEALLRKVYEIIEKHPKEICQCSAIIIEDDLDGNFNDIDERNSSIREKICSIIKQDIPVFILYASPEIEGWFIADWDNGFGYIYDASECVKDIESNAKTFFTHHLRQYINEYILKEYKDDIEHYGYFDSQYYKLSDELIKAIQNDVKGYILALPNTNQDFAKQIESSRDLYYSKKIHGDRMLRKLDPAGVANKCRYFFQPVYEEIRRFECTR